MEVHDEAGMRKGGLRRIKEGGREKLMKSSAGESLHDIRASFLERKREEGKKEGRRSLEVAVRNERLVG